MQVIRDYYDIAILPHREVSEYCIKKSRELDERFGSQFVLGRAENIPHITLFHTAFARENLNALKRRLKDLAREQKTFEAHFAGFINYPHVGYVTISIEPKKPFLSLHKKIIDITKDLVERNFPYRDIWDYSELSDKQKLYVEKYTSPSVMEFYNAHITLGRLKAYDRMSEVEEKVRIDEMEFRVEVMALCTLAEHHTCQEVIFRFPFT